MDLDNTLVVMPALNEAATIANVVQALREQGLIHIRVVDNGSQDGTAAEAAQAGAEVVQEPIKGYGQACWRGLQAIPDGIEWILFCDADGSDDLRQLPEFFAQRESHDLILGNRRGTKTGRQQLSSVQNFGNCLSGTLIALGWGYRFHDLGPLRLVRKTALDQIGMCDRNFGWTVEMQARAIECGLRICELPVNYLPRQGGQSKISGTLVGSFKAGTIILSTLAALYWKTLWPSDAVDFSHEKRQPILLFLSTLLLLAGTVYILPYGNFKEPFAVPHFWVGSACMGSGFVLSWRLRSIPSFWFWSVAIVTRLLLITMYPGDDIWRYIWEGHIQLQGYSPYDFAPLADVLKSFRPEWWGEINHPYASAIYPPITQLGFRTLASIGLWVSLFKAAFTAADLAICWLLGHRFGRRATLLYAWNPLVLYSFAGGGHYDSWFVLPLVMAWFWFDRPGGDTFDKPFPPLTYLGSSLLVGISIAVKWISLPILTFLVWHAIRRKRIGIAVLSGIMGLLPMVLAAIPYCSLTSCPLVQVNSSFVVTGRSAELIPHIVGQFWDPSRSANWLYAFPLALVVVWLLLRASTFHKFTEWYLIGLMVISPIVHFWYLSWLMPFLVLSRNLGLRLISLSAYTYFTLLYMASAGNYSWLLPAAQRHILWWPFILGIAWSSARVTWPGLAVAPKLTRT
ncbi:glycosyl transferase [Leptolyngbya sp. Heron Island J]|uniref:glycosyltransferase family 2 protein n=1 Tax=Leptolyngbya sp. Heron Island J TaxID=1385935 RepID=UPI0003B957B6|nr:glycosyltransferase family 2 protein [Leptolyngbya sp. Heron Island J]ESA36788.1 glycosyl transferase [Leptolyngbya sp. Heron Island J]